MAYFDGQPAIVYMSGGQISAYYGGIGPGHGHVKATGGPLGKNTVYWRLPESKGGQVIVDNSWETMNGNDLRDHLTDF
jgi:hypothetical protein cdivTM_09441